jgi:hypothetical protein
MGYARDSAKTRTSLYSTKNPNRVLCNSEKLTCANYGLFNLTPKLVDDFSLRILSVKKKGMKLAYLAERLTGAQCLLDRMLIVSSSSNFQVAYWDFLCF